MPADLDTPPDPPWTRVPVRASWDDLVLPAATMERLREIALDVRQHERVMGDWGFSGTTFRSSGMNALFVGSSGTGKTLAAAVLANALALDLYHIELGRVVSKYIGETEKNLARVFEAAGHGGVILLFDEADALFGRRSDVQDSHDRYANVEVSYLLQRMEAHPGLTILATNSRSALDPAFIRRVHHVVDFPWPDAEQRLAIWQRAFPPALDCRDLDFGRLAPLELYRGDIRNIARRCDGTHLPLPRPSRDGSPSRRAGVGPRPPSSPRPSILTIHRRQNLDPTFPQRITAI